LQRLPLDEVKIDLQFVQTMLQDPNAEAIVKLIINLAKTLNLRVVAEGVESQNELALLEILGCQHFQGYFFGKPQADPYRPQSE
jgi:EAL domain-containing protein (putative c-di-GMP-specific phosphodiesterase class I)